MKLPSWESLNWQKNLPKPPAMKRFQRTFQGFHGRGQGNFGKFAQSFKNLWSQTDGK